jgi:hypothetical protein
MGIVEFQLYNQVLFLCNGDIDGERYRMNPIIEDNN